MSTPSQAQPVFHPVNGSRLSQSDAVVIGSYLYQMAQAKNIDVEGLTPEEIFDAAKCPDSPLHPYFQWDKEEGWRQHNLDIARYLVRSIVVEIQRLPSKQTTFELPAMVSVEVRSKERAYIPVQVALDNPEYLRQIRTDALRQLRHWHNRTVAYMEYDGFASWQPLLESIAVFLHEIDTPAAT